MKPNILHTIYKIPKRVGRFLTKTRRRKILSSILAILMVLTTIRFAFFKPTEVSADSLFNLDEGYGTTVNDSAGSASGTITGATWQTSDLCRREKCLYFDGSDWISFGDEASFDITASQNFTIQFWFRHMPATANEVIISKLESTGTDGGYRISMAGDGDILYEKEDDDADTTIDDSVTSTAANYDDNRWHQVSVVKSGTSSLFLYIDANLVDESTGPATTDLTNDDTFYIGDSDGTDNGDEFIGFIDEVKVYTSTARTADEIKADFLQSTPSRGTSALFSPDMSFLSDGLIGYWKMDDAGVDTEGELITDSSGNANSGTLKGDDGTGDNGTGMDCTVGAKFGTGCDFDGTDDYVTMGDPDLFEFSDGQDFSIAGWFNRDTFTTDDAIVGKRDAIIDGAQGYLAWIDDATDKLTFEVCDANGSCDEYQMESVSTFTSTGWNHFMVVWDDDDELATTIYINGVAEDVTRTGTFADIDNSFASPREFEIGANHIGEFPFDGKIDEVRVYNRALQSSEVADLYNFGPGPVGEWKLDEGSGTNANDSSGNGNLGSSSGTSWANGKYGKALEYDALSDNLNAGSNTSLDNVFDGGGTYSLWVNPDSKGSGGINGVVINKHPVGIEHQGESGGKIKFAFFAQFSGTDGYWTTDNFEIPINEWSHIAVTYNSSSDTNDPTIYLNGVTISLTETSTPSGTRDSDDSNNLHIGNNSSSGKGYDGAIDDVRIYNYARTPGQIIEDMNAGHPAPGSPVGSAYGHWRFDEGYGDTTFDSGTGGNDGDLAGSGTTCPSGAAGNDCPTQTNDGKFGKALDYDGDDDFVDFGDITDLDLSDTDDLAISGWFNRDSFDTNDTIVAKRNGSAAGDVGFKVHVRSSDELIFEISDGTDEYQLTSSTTFTSTGWNHFVVVWDEDSATNSKIYINGIDDNASDTGTIGDIGAANGPSLRTGTNSVGGDPFDGRIDEVRIYKSTLTSAQVKTLYNQSSAAVWGANSTDSSGNADWSQAREYCPPGNTETNCGGSNDPSPVLEWKLNENSGSTAQDTSGNDNSGTLTNSPTYVPGRYGTGLSLAGSNQHVTRADDADLDFGASASFTLETWFKHNTASATETLISKLEATGTDGGYKLKMESDGDITCETDDDDADTTIDDTATTTAANYDDNNWHHVACVYDTTNTDLLIYIDGELVASDTTTTTNSLANDDAFFYGIESATGTEDWIGELDQLLVYNYARTQAQVAWAYNRGGPVGWWKFDECSGTTANDSGSGGNNGTIDPQTGGTNTAVGTCSGGTGMWGNGATGKRNSSLDFDGTDDYVSISDADELSFGDGASTDRPFTFSAWLNMVDATSLPILTKCNDATSEFEYNFTVDSNDKLSIAAYDDSSLNRITANTNLALTSDENSWIHIAATYDGSGANTGFKLYRNGKELAVTTGSLGTYVAMHNHAVNPTIGRTCVDLPFYAEGQIDEVMIFNYALSAQQVRDVYNNGALFYGPSSGSP